MRASALRNKYRRGTKMRLDGRILLYDNDKDDNNDDADDDGIEDNNNDDDDDDDDLHL